MFPRTCLKVATKELTVSRSAGIRKRREIFCAQIYRGNDNFHRVGIDMFLIFIRALSSPRDITVLFVCEILSKSGMIKLEKALEAQFIETTNCRGSDETYDSFRELSFRQ